MHPMRPEQLNPLFADVQTLSGIGPKLANTLDGFIGRRVINLLFHIPYNIIDRRARPALTEVVDGQIASFEIDVVSHHPPPRRTLPYRVICAHETGLLQLVFFHAHNTWLKKALPVGGKRIVSGRIEHFREQVQMVHPDHIATMEEFARLPAIEPVYPLTAGLTAKPFLKTILAALPYIPALNEWQDETWLSHQNWPYWHVALQKMHQPQNEQDLDINAPHRRRLAYDELLANQLSLALARRYKREQMGRAFPRNDRFMVLRDKCLTLLPFALTRSQSQAIEEIGNDMEKPEAMLRLLQGDVGSGKTFVALMSALHAIASGAQVAIMAPTEILARQHVETLAPFLDALNIRWGLFTGRNKTKQRAQNLNDLAHGNIQFAIGTHALFQDDIIFDDLGLAIVDEQHRFGVKQRMKLSQKARKGTDILVMTATPIPRTLMLAGYGDMDVSRMFDKPATRKPITTRVMHFERYDEIVDGLARIFSRGEQAFWICPLVSESEKLDLAAAEDRFHALKKIYGAKIGLVHGQMKAEQKDDVMRRFHAGDIHLLVATTVVEVGVNIPTATVMIIEHAERFGLAQLHQLRGRVGRGEKPASCILLYHGTLGEIARARLDLLRQTEDGFLIAEEDLRLRGAGEMLGTKQSGVPYFRLANLEFHGDLLPVIHDDVNLILQNDARLTSTRGHALRLLLYLFERDDAIQFLRAG